MSKCAIAIGASAGGLEALYEILGGLPPDLRAPVFVTVHLAPRSPSLLPSLISSRSRLTAIPARMGQPIQDGVVYCAPPDLHLVVTKSRVKVGYGPKQNFNRPAIDPLFISASEAFGRRAVGVILSGNNDDGTYGLKVLRSRGGIGIAQDPGQAVFPRMPLSAVQVGCVDHVLPAGDIAAKLVELVEGFFKAKPRGRKVKPGREAREAGPTRSLVTSRMGRCRP